MLSFCSLQQQLCLQNAVSPAYCLGHPFRKFGPECLSCNVHNCEYITHALLVFHVDLMSLIWDNLICQCSLSIICRHLHGLLHCSGFVFFNHLKWRELTHQLCHCLSSPHIYCTADSLAPLGLTSLQQTVISFPSTCSC